MINKLHNIDVLEGLKKLENNSINTIITSPPYNKKGLIGKKSKDSNQIWNKFNIDYDLYDDNMLENDYQKWQINVLNECFRVLKDDGSMFYNHKIRRFKNKAYSPYEIIRETDFKLYQIIIWNRKNSPNIRKDILTPSTEYIYWLSKKKPKVFKNEIPLQYRGEVWDISPIKQKGHPALTH